MTRPVAIVLDSTTSMPAGLVEEYGFTVLPNTLIWDGNEYRDGVDITIEDFLARLSSGKSVPTTAAVSPEAFRSVFESLVEEGKDVLMVSPTSRMTRVPLAAAEAKEQIKGGAVEVVDTRAFGMATGWAAILAARAAREGADLSTCKAMVEKYRGGIVGFANRLDMLRSSGRINRFQEILGSQLQVKPILATLDDGSIDPIERVRTRSRAIDRVIEIVVERIAGQGPIYVGIQHVDAEADAQRTLETLAGQIVIQESTVSSLGPSPATHFGPGAVGITYLIASD